MSANYRLSELKSAKNLTDLAKIISVPLQSLTYVLNGTHRLGINNYSTFTIPKKNGGLRTINEPIQELKDIQRKISSLLQDCLNIIYIIEGHRTHNKKIISIAHGFTKGKSIISNAEPHRNKKIVLNLDLENFFGSIHYGRVLGYFLSNRHFELEPVVAQALSNLICFSGGLPQGAPTSPVMSNLIASILDIRLISLANKYDLYYTRYADDLTFSTNLSEFPTNVASVENEKTEIGKDLIKIIHKCGFKINNNKNRLQFKKSRQDVTGLIVNKIVNVRIEYRKSARVLWHKLLNDKVIYAIESKPEDKKDINYLVGVLSYIHNVRKSQRIRTNKDTLTLKKPTKQMIDASLDADAKMYRDVLFFKHFITNKKPLIICEGKTDIVYLRSALESLQSKHRSLISRGVIKLDFLKISPTFRELFKVAGGTGDIGNLISNYSSYCDQFKRFNPENVVIILIDNDSGAHTLRSLINQITGSSFDKKDNFKHIIRNLYILQTPLIGNKDSAIEDLFDRKTLSTKLGTKTFSYKGTFDASKYYGKNHFADYVIRPSRKKIDFTGFNPLFDSIKQIIKDFKPK